MKFFFHKEELRGRTRIFLSGPMTALLLLLLSGGICLLCLYLQPGPLLELLRTFLQQPLLIPLNWFPALILTLLFYFLTRNAFYGGAIGGGLLMLLSYINLLKIEGREDPFVPADIFLFREALNAAQEYQLAMHWDKIAVMLLALAVLVLAGYFLKSARPRLPWRLACAAMSVVVLVGAVQFVYRSKTLYKSFTVPDANNVALSFNTLGFPYCFLYNYNLYPVDRPEDFSRAEVEQWIDSGAQTQMQPRVQPNVIMIMCEAFSDLADEPVFGYAEQDNPLAEFHRVAQSERALSGHIVVSNYGAGTANTEFDVLTGMQTNMISDDTTSAFRVVRKQTASVASVLADSGYHTFFLHPWHNWFYNRASVYAHLGITDQVFIEAFDESDYKGTMISDEAFLDELKADLKTRLLESSAPLFTYGVTIQNHQTYYYTKYDTRPTPVTVPVSDAAREQLEVYFEGIRDSSRMLAELTEYLDTIDEPTVLVFFGDHRPNLGTACEELGFSWPQGDTPEQTVSAFSVPFVLWSNRAYADAVDLPEEYASLQLPANHTISDNYLGAVVLQLLGRQNATQFFGYLNQMRLTLPVVRDREGIYGLSDGTYTTAPTAEQSALVAKLDKWAYYQLKY